MKYHIHFHFYSKLVITALVLVVALFVLQKSENIIANSNPPNPVDIGGWAWSDTVGWISLNCKNDFDGDGLLEDTCGSFPYKLEVNDVGNIVGCAWGGTSRNSDASTTIGYICFSDSGGTEAPTDGMHIVTESGICEGPTTCTLDSQCNPPGGGPWFCSSSGYCQVECFSDIDCRSGDTCDDVKGSNFICGLDFPYQPGCDYLNGGYSASIVDLEDVGYEAWRLNFSRIYFELTTSTLFYDDAGFDHDNPQWNDMPINQPLNPIDGCFNCSEQRIGNCLYRNIACVEGDTVCEDVGILVDSCDAGFCQHAGTECDIDDDCPDLTDECVIDDVVYNCDNCLDYRYYDQENVNGKGDQCSYSAKSCVYNDAAYANGYSFRRIITIDHTKIYGDNPLVDFPFLIEGDLDYLAWTGRDGDVENVNGYDIVFSINADGSGPLDHELEYYDFRDGSISTWVRIPSLSATTTDTTIYMFYGNPSITTSQEEALSVWNDYYFVAHMDDYNSNTIKNSASTSLELGTKYGIGSTEDSVMVALGQHFNGDDDYIDFGDISVPSLPVTVSAYVKILASETGEEPYNMITSDDDISANTGVWLRLANQIEIGFGDGTGRQTKSSNDTVTGTSHFFTGVIGSTDSADMKVYDNGVEKTNVTVSGNLSSYAETTSTPLRVGYRTFGAPTDSYFTGSLDEVRISSLERNADWIMTEYRNQTNPNDLYEIGCQQRDNTDDDACNCTNPDYSSNFSCLKLVDGDNCDVCEKAELGDLYKVLGGFDCSNCTIQDFTNSCTLNSYEQNLNSCIYCRYVYDSPGLMFDNKNNSLPTTTPPNGNCDPNQDDPGVSDFCKRGKLCGWGSNSWNIDYTDYYGLGWFQFSPRITTTSKPYFSVEGGNIYSRGSIFSRYSPPFGKYNATYLIEAGGEIVNIISSSTISNTYEGELANRPTIDFFELLQVGNSSKYKSSLGLIDYTGLITDVSTGAVGTGVNKYGSSISTNNLNDILSSDFNGELKYDSGDHTFDSTGLNQDFQIGASDSTGIIVIDGDLTIEEDITYESGVITSYKQIPSLVWIVRGDVLVDPSVTQLVGTFIVLGEDGTTCPSIPGVSSCGTFFTGDGSNQLVVHGSVLAHSFSLGRTYYDASGEPSEKFINEGRLQANPPRGLEDLNKLSPRYNF